MPEQEEPRSERLIRIGIVATVAAVLAAVQYLVSSRSLPVIW